MRPERRRRVMQQRLHETREKAESYNKRPGDCDTLETVKSSVDRLWERIEALIAIGRV